jgi:hypothetical protein
MWKGVQQSIASVGDNPIGAVNAGMDKVLGPSFDYLQTIKSPKDLGVGSAGNMGQVFTNTQAISTYVGNLIRGPKVGNQFFKDTGGLCKAPGGGLVQRHTWINNKLGGDDAAAILGPSFQNAVSGSGFDGIIPGAGGDIASLNPLKIMNGLVLDGVPDCQAFDCPITDIASGNDKGRESQFICPSLEFNLNGCRIAGDQAGLEARAVKAYANGKKEITQKKPEKFGSQFSEVMVRYDSGPYVLLGVAFLALFFGVIARRK